MLTEISLICLNFHLLALEIPFVDQHSLLYLLDTEFIPDTAEEVAWDPTQDI